MEEIKMTVKKNNRTAVFESLEPYCVMAGEHDFMEVTHWTNGEGVDVHISRNKTFERFSLTYGEFELLQVLFLYKELE
jgi:hypothetical protein